MLIIELLDSVHVTALSEISKHCKVSVDVGIVVRVVVVGWVELCVAGEIRCCQRGAGNNVAATAAASPWRCIGRSDKEMLLGCLHLGWALVVVAGGSWTLQAGHIEA